MAEAPTPERRPVLRRGGARNRADRKSWHLTEAKCRCLIEAAGIAWAAGTPFNRFATLAFGKCGIDAPDCVAATGDWIKMARDWLASQGHSMRWAWVQEWGRINKAHCHILFHVPPSIAPLFKRKAQRWARTVIDRRGGTYVAGTTDCQIIRSSDHPESYAAAYHASLAFKVHYMLKCAPADLEVRLGMAGRGMTKWGQSCPVYGKRLAVWQGWQRCTEEGRNWLA